MREFKPSDLFDADAPTTRATPPFVREFFAQRAAATGNRFISSAVTGQDVPNPHVESQIEVINEDTAHNLVLEFAIRFDDVDLSGSAENRMTIQFPGDAYELEKRIRQEYPDLARDLDRTVAWNAPPSKYVF